MSHFQDIVRYLCPTEYGKKVVLVSRYDSKLRKKVCLTLMSSFSPLDTGNGETVDGNVCKFRLHETPDT